MEGSEMIPMKSIIAAGLVAASLTTAAPALATSGSVSGEFKGNKFSAAGETETTTNPDSSTTTKARGSATLTTSDDKTYTVSGTTGDDGVTSTTSGGSTTVSCTTCSVTIGNVTYKVNGSFTWP